MAEPAVDLLCKRCGGCHGAKTQLSGLRLDERAGALRVIVPGNAVASRMMAMVSGAPGAKLMPPAGARLTETELGLLRNWIDSGAPYPALARAAEKLVLPEPARREWVRQPVDRFVLVAMEDAGVLPKPEAGRRVWARRVSFDLTGLPPADDELEEFLLDNRADAYERFADRLLMSAPVRADAWTWLLPEVKASALLQKWLVEEFPSADPRLARMIVLSAAYRQQRPPRALTAVERRNALLAVSGLLSPDAGKYARVSTGAMTQELESEVLRALTWRYEQKGIRDAAKLARERLASDEFRVKE